MNVYLAPGLFAWSVTLEGGETRQLLSATVPSGGFAMPVIAATRGPAYPPGPMPTIGGLVPPSVKAGGANITLHVNGSGFRVGDVILWNGAPVPTTVISPTELTTPVTVTSATPSTVAVAVRALSGGVSDAATFTFTP